jgi:hypothetical protein
MQIVRQNENEEGPSANIKRTMQIVRQNENEEGPSANIKRATQMRLSWMITVVPQEDGVEDPPVGHDDGIWMDDDAYGVVKGEELNNVPPEGENPWEYLWKPGAPPFKMELIACAERRNVEGLVKSLYCPRK